MTRPERRSISPMLQRQREQKQKAVALALREPELLKKDVAARFGISPKTLTEALAALRNERRAG